MGLKFRRSLSLFSLSKCVYPPANKSQMLNFRSTCSHTFPSNVAGAAAFRIRMDISKRIFVSLEKDVHCLSLFSDREKRRKNQFTGAQIYVQQQQQRRQQSEGRSAILYSSVAYPRQHCTKEERAVPCSNFPPLRM